VGRSLRILIAPNAFKGSLTVLEAARAMARGAKRAYPDAEVLLLPISDGGDGLIDALLTARGGRRIHVPVRGPLGEKRQAPYGRLDPRTAVIEMALASGLALVPPEKRDALAATSFGTGQLVDAALRAGAKKLLVGLGGSATNDGGAGMAQALGYSLRDAAGRELAPGVAALLSLDKIVAPPQLKLRLAGVKVYAVTDVTNPLLGPEGSARVYGPQKGALPAPAR
jgi:glycerate kinase